MKLSLPKEAYWTTELLHYYIEKRYERRYNFFYFIQEQDEDPRFNKHLKSRVHLVNISFQRKTDFYDAKKQTICLIKIPGKEHVYSIVGYSDQKTGENDLESVVWQLNRQRCVSFYPGMLKFTSMCLIKCLIIIIKIFRWL
jgi:hypothetical protein